MASKILNSSKVASEMEFELTSAGMEKENVCEALRVLVRKVKEDVESESSRAKRDMLGEVEEAEELLMRMDLEWEDPEIEEEERKDQEEEETESDKRISWSDEEPLVRRLKMKLITWKLAMVEEIKSSVSVAEGGTADVEDSDASGSSTPVQPMTLEEMDSAKQTSKLRRRGICIGRGDR